jgi:hypothetical protein
MEELQRAVDAFELERAQWRVMVSEEEQVRGLVVSRGVLSSGRAEVHPPCHMHGSVFGGQPNTLHFSSSGPPLDSFMCLPRPMPRPAIHRARP